MARQYLCVPATSAGAERLFSRASLTYGDLRTCLSEKNLSNILFAAYNYDPSLHGIPDTVRSITVLKNTCGVSQASSYSSVLPSCLLCMRNRSKAQGHNRETGFYAGLPGYLKK